MCKQEPTSLNLYGQYVNIPSFKTTDKFSERKWNPKDENAEQKNAN